MLRDATTGDWIGTFSGHKGAVWSTRFDPTASLVATASGDFTVKVWDAITGKELYNFVHDHVVKTVDWSSNSKWLATGGHEGILRIFDIENPEKEPRKLFVISPRNGVNNNEKEKRVSISKVNWFNDSIVLAAGEDGIIRFWDVSSSCSESNNDNESKQQHLVRTLQVVDDDGGTSSSSGIRDMELVTIPSTQQTILTVAAGQHVSFYDMSTLQLLHSYAMPIHFREEGGASLHPITGSKFVVGGGRKGGSMASGSNANGDGGGGELGSDLIVYVYDYHTGQMLEKYKGHHGPIRCVRYHPDGKSYATGSEDGTIRIWKTDP
jgi:serine-threonine kinase receptor-associated protein